MSPTERIQVLTHNMVIAYIKTNGHIPPATQIDSFILQSEMIVNYGIDHTSFMKPDVKITIPNTTS